MTSTLEYALADASRWLLRLKQRGIDLTAQAHRKTVHEAIELADDPSLEEWADVAICLMGVALAQGWHFGELADAIQAKVAINAARDWQKQHDGTYQHAVNGGSTPLADRQPTPTAQSAADPELLPEALNRPNSSKDAAGQEP